MLTIIKSNGAVIIYTNSDFSKMEEDEIEYFIMKTLNLNPLNVVWGITKTVQIKEAKCLL